MRRMLGPSSCTSTGFVTCRRNRRQLTQPKARVRTSTHVLGRRSVLVRRMRAMRLLLRQRSSRVADLANESKDVSLGQNTVVTSPLDLARVLNAVQGE